MPEASPPPQPLKTSELIVFAEHFQFYLYDQSADPGEFSVYWPQEAREQLLLLSDRIIGIGTVRSIDVPVQIHIYDDEPSADDLDEFDHVMQCSIEVPSGKLVVSGPTEDFSDPYILDVAPGTYGVRICYAGLSQIDEEGFEGDDSYTIAIWKTATPPPAAMLREWEHRTTFVYK